MAEKTPPESWEQEQFFRWVYANQIKRPELQLCNGSMNGVRVSAKQRAGLKSQGLRPGVPDIDLPVKRGEYAGLRIELKRVKGGTVSVDQKRFHHLLAQQGYRVEVCKGWRAAVDVMVDYLDSGMAHGTSCTRCANAQACPAYDPRMLYGFCRGFVEYGGVEIVREREPIEALVEDLEGNADVDASGNVFGK